MPRAAGPPGHFIARYLPPAERYPQVALLVVELASGARRMHVAARIALEGSTVVPFHTSPGASVTMRVADRSFGPVVADRQGRVEIPIQVPPGDPRRHRPGRRPATARRARPRSTCSCRRSRAWWCWRRPRSRSAASPRSSCSRVEPDGDARQLRPADAGRVRRPAPPARRGRAGRGALPVRGAPAARERRRRADRDGGRAARQPRRHRPSRCGWARPRSSRSPPARTRLVVGSGERRASPFGARRLRQPDDRDRASRSPSTDSPARSRSTPGGLGTLTVDAPAKFDGRERITIEARAGRASAPATSCT